MTEIPNLALGAREIRDGDHWAVACCEEEAPAVDGLVDEVAAAALRLARRAGWRGGDKQRAETELGSGASLSLEGLGKGAELAPRRLADWLERAFQAAQANGRGRLVVVLPDHAETAGAAAAERVARTLLLAGYRFDRYRSEPARTPPLREVTVVPPPAAAVAYREAMPAAAAVARGSVLCRELANTPGNEAGPDWMEEQARRLAAACGMRFAALHEDELRRRGMGGLLAVGSGSPRGPRLVRLDWGSAGPAVALVGKGVTFDTGGISIKPATDMDEMKYDKCGATTVLGIARAVADLALPLRLSFYLPLVENMPDGAAYRPGDIVRCYNGKTVEIVNTDAEGRLVLADALAWAAEEEPDAILEYSTLTGAAVVALGYRAAALYTPDDGLAAELAAAADRCGERLWRMPVWPEFLDQMRGSHADLKNSGGRWGGANTAAAFLGQFVGGVTRWAHLDIAGAAYLGNDQEEPRGATGYGIHFTLDWLRRLAS